MKKIALNLGILLIVAAIAFFTFAPAYIDNDMNVVDGKPLPEIRPEAQALHNTLTVVDLHSDTFLWKRDVLEGAERGHMDLPRLQKGNVALQIFSSVTKTPTNQNYDNNSADGDNVTALVIGQLQPIRTWTSLLERSLWHAQKRDEATASSAGNFIAVDTNAQLARLLENRAAGAPETVGALLSIEGLHNLEGKAENLDVLYNAGFRMAGLTHFFDNDLAGSMHGEEKGGLTPFGRDIVQRMEAKGMIVDIAHLSKKATAEVLALAKRPLVSSHGGVQATCDVNRNLTDEEIRGVAATGGVIGVGYWEGAVCDTSPEAIVTAMKHVRDLVGIEHIALGSDYDGTVTVRFDTAGLVHVTQELMDEGYSEPEIRAVMGDNAIRVISQGLIPLSELPVEASSEDEDLAA